MLRTWCSRAGRRRATWKWSDLLANSTNVVISMLRFDGNESKVTREIWEMMLLTLLPRLELGGSVVCGDALLQSLFSTLRQLDVRTQTFVVYVLQVTLLFSAVGAASPCRQIPRVLCYVSPRRRAHYFCRTKARVAWKVVLYFSNLASICSHALILLSQTRWIVVTGWCTSISLQPFVQTRLDYGSLLNTSISIHPVFPKPCVSKPFELWILVCVHASVSSLVFQTRLDGDSLFVYKHQSPALSSVSCPVFKHVWILVPVCVHAPVNSPLFQILLFVVAFLRALPPTPK